ncbi:MAG TPA: DUF4954 family protein [Chitinophagaceae bacterium]|nr:DUF4954 family protein [Chitinophagaceae bacterium]
MNEIQKSPVGSLGYGFVAAGYLPAGRDEYYLRDLQNRSGIRYRQLTAHEIETLVRNRNTSDDWNKVLVSDAFNPELVRNCRFFGLVRIGKLEPWYLEFNNLRIQVGLYDSTIISCDFGDNVVVSNVNYMSHYITGNEVMIINVNELATTDHAKFGNGILKEGERESVRIWLEVCNENGGRRVIPFNGMLPGDAYLWTRHRDDDLLMDRFKEFTEKKFDRQRGYYGKIGDRTIIKNTRIIKDVWIGSDAYIKGANKLKNLTINSSPEAKSQIGEGCELVNGIIGFGCKAFYGVKAVRFVLASHSQLKYGARLINSYLGNNATISCCEVLNSLIFPAHEQHHNNSFLCAALIMGQSNMAAGATIGSNHNSRGADGELVAGRGFWPGLCVSLKHNSRFATFCLIAKGDFPAELNIPLPFSLVSNDVHRNRLVVMPAYWFLYNMYALARNAHKYVERDHRTERTQHLEFDFLAPDSVNEIFEALTLLERFTGRAAAARSGRQLTGNQQEKLGRKWLEARTPELEELDILAEGFENLDRPTELVKVPQAYQIFRELVVYYGITQLLAFIRQHHLRSWEKLWEALPGRARRGKWTNVGGQLIPETALQTLIRQIHTGKVKSWDEVHDFYRKCGEVYGEQKWQHAFASLLEISGTGFRDFDKKLLRQLLQQALDTKEWMVKRIYESRAKDYHNAFRSMVYASREEMERVVGKMEDNSFIHQQVEELRLFRREVRAVIRNLKL